MVKTDTGHAFVLLIAILTTRVKEGFTQATPQEEAKANTIAIEIYDVSESKWVDSLRAEFKTILSESANTYCTATPQDCGLNSNWESTSQFQAENVFDMATGKEASRFQYNYTMQFPDQRQIIVSDSSPTNYYLPKRALNASSQLIVDSFYDKTGYNIVLVGGVKYHIRPNHTLNIIISCIALAVVIILAIGTCIAVKKCGGPPEAIEREQLKPKSEMNGNHAVDMNSVPPSTISQAGQSDIRIEEFKDEKSASPIAGEIDNHGFTGETKVV